MTGSTADQIIERIADANGTEPAVMRQMIEQALQNIIADTAQPHSFMLADMFPGGKPTVDELVVALEYELYAALMPIFPGGNGMERDNKSWQADMTCQLFYAVFR